MATYGSSSTAGMGIIGSGQLRGSVYGEWADDAWVTSISARLGRDPNGSNATARMGLYTTANNNPSTLVGQSAAFTVSAAMDNGAGGQVYTQTFTGGALRVAKGGLFAIGIAASSSATLRHAMVPAASSPFSNRNFYYSEGVTSNLPSPFGYTDSSYEGNISAWVDYTVNRAPTASTSVPNTLETSTSVTFKGKFTDPDSVHGDKMLRFLYEVQTSAGAAVYNSGWVAASATEAANGEFSRARTLSAGSYRWRCRVQDQFGEASAYTAWRSFSVHANRKPTAATVVPSGLQTTSSVNFQGTFSDPDETITKDKLAKFQFQVINNTTKAIVYNSGWLTPNSTEVTNKRFSRTVTTLPAGVDYAWRTQVQDSFGALSDWTGYRTFSINAGGAVDTLSGVGGKQDTQQPSSFLSVWRHANDLNATKFQFRILQGGQQIKLGNEIPTNQPPNANLNAAWSTAFGTYKLPWGSRDLTWQVRAWDSSGVQTNWSVGRAFTINAAPAVPTNLTPSNSAASGKLPLLRCRAVDDDNDVLSVTARIKNQEGQVLQTRPMVLVDGWYQYQTTTDDIADYGTFSWDAYSFDGTLYSGEQATEDNAQKSASAVFVYAAVPDVVVLSPSDGSTIAGTVTVSWQAIPNQEARRIIVTNVATGQVVSNTNWQSVTTTSQVMTASEMGFRRGDVYSLVVELRDTNGLVGTSETITFTIDYDLPSPINQFIATPEMVGSSADASAIMLSWQPYENDDFQRYTVTRLTEGDSRPVVLAVITNPYETSFTDLVPPVGIENQYAIVLTTLQGLDITDSEPATTFGLITLDNVVLQNVYQPNQHVPLLFDSGREFDHIDDVVMEMAWGAPAPVAIHTGTNYQVFSGEFTLVPDATDSAREHIQALRALYRSKQTICYRDERGRRFFGTITSFNESDERVGQYTVSLEITETLFMEGV